MESDRFDGDIEMNMRKVCLLFVQMCRLVWSSSLVVCRQVPQNNLKMRLKTLLFASHWLAPHHRRIRMAIEITSNSPSFFVVADSLLPTNIAK